MSDLTPIEARIISMLAHGHTKDEIAKALKIAPATMRYYLKHAKYKLGVKTNQRDNAHVIYVAMKAGVIE